MVLQRLYDLSDPAMEEDIARYAWPIRLAEQFFFGMALFVVTRICFEMMRRSNEFIQRFAR